MGSRRTEIHSLNATQYEYDEGLEITLEKAAQIIDKIKMSDQEKEVIECLNET